MDSVDQIAEQIVAREGGFVNDPDDPGGATNHGVTIGTMRRLGIDVNEDGLVDARDVRALTRAQAKQIFLRHYFISPGIDKLPTSVQASVFDMQVNSGANAIRILQRLLTRMGFEARDDGVIGPNTLAAAAAAARAAPAHLADAYAIARRNYYYALADHRTASRKYARRRDGGKGGWITRAEEFMRSKYRLSTSQHSGRVAKWG